MCGLVAVVNKKTNGFTKEQQDVFSTLLLIDFVRGPDSTGVFGVSNHGEVMLAKEASDPIRYMRSEAYREIMDKTFQSGSALVGHNRKATRGSVTDDNAHPFVVDDNIVLVHNGTVWGDHKKMADVEVDSHAIAHTIHETGDVTKALSSIDGAYALIWYDFKAGTLNFIRNKERPLWWMETNDSWIWSSEKAMLDFVAEREILIVKDGPSELPENYLQKYTLEYNNWSTESAKLDIQKPKYWPGSPISHPLDRSGDACAYGNNIVWPDPADVEDDIPFKHQGRVLQLPVKNDLQRGVDIEHLAKDEKDTIKAFERKMASKINKIVTLDEFREEICPAYPQGVDVLAQTFEYTYANTKDDSGGFYLYSAVNEYPDLIVRYYYPRDHMTEERMISIAGGEYIFKFQIDKKRWAAFQPGIATGRSPGYAIMIADKAIVVYGGGIGDDKYKPAGKAQKQQVH